MVLILQVLKILSLDSYTVTAQNSDVATASTGDVGGTGRQQQEICYLMYSTSCWSYATTNTTISTTMRNTTGKTLEGSETEFTLDTCSNVQLKSVNFKCRFL